MNCIFGSNCVSQVCGVIFTMPPSSYTHIANISYVTHAICREFDHAAQSGIIAYIMQSWMPVKTTASVILPHRFPFTFVFIRMGYHQDFQDKAKGFEERQPPIPSSFPSAEMTSPPSYHSFDELLEDHTVYHRGSVCQERNRGAEQAFSPRERTARNEELRRNQRERDDHRKQTRRRRSSSSHSSVWSAKLILQGLKYNLLGSGSTSQSGRHSRTRTPASRTTNLDLGSHAGDVHYTIHNHWHDTTRSEPLSHATSWPDRQPFDEVTSGALPSARFDMQSTACNTAGKPWYQSHQIPLEAYVSGFIPHTFERYDPSSVWENLNGGVARHRPSEESCPCSTRDFHKSGRPGHKPASPEDYVHATAQKCADFPAAAAPDPTIRLPSDGNNGHRHHDRNNQQPQTSPSSPPKPERVMPDAATVLANYNKHWEYIESVQQPYLHELPWPTIRPSVSFDHMKCDVFSFFAQACGLQPDGIKAPKLDFKLASRSPYTSYNLRQQESERMMLKMFKQQMQREKLRWHEDKLRRKFPGAFCMGEDRDAEKRKAVWAAIAEGSTVCDKRLENIL